MELYQNGNYQAFQLLYERHGGRVYGYLKKRMSDAVEAEDLTQQAFLKLHQSRDRYDGRYPFLPWLFSIVRNLHIDYLKKHRAIPMDLDKFTLSGDLGSTVRETPGVVLALDKSVTALTPAQRELINLRFQEGLSFEEISERIGIQSSTARKQVSRLIKKIRKVIKRD